MKRDRNKNTAPPKTILVPLILTCLLGCEESAQQENVRFAKNRVDLCMDSVRKESNEEVQKLVSSACEILQTELDKLKNEN